MSVSMTSKITSKKPSITRTAIKAQILQFAATGVTSVRIAVAPTPMPNSWKKFIKNKSWFVTSTANETSYDVSANSCSNDSTNDLGAQITVEERTQNVSFVL